MKKFINVAKEVEESLCMTSGPYFLD